MISHTCLILPGAMPSPSFAAGLGATWCGGAAARACAAVAAEGPDPDEPTDTSTAAPTAAMTTHVATTLNNLMRHLPACRHRTRHGLSPHRWFTQADLRRRDGAS